MIQTTPGKVYANIDLGPLTTIFRFKLVIIATNWIFQGLLYADKTERIFKISLDLLVTIVLFLSLPHSPFIMRLLTAFLISHSCNWIFNGQIFALLKNFNYVNNDPQRIIEYANGIKIRAFKESSIDYLAVYGSLSRSEIKPTSDLDLRIVRKNGVMNGLNACIFATKERSRAFFNRFPLDVYVVDGNYHLLKLRHDEKPIILS